MESWRLDSQALKHGENSAWFSGPGITLSVGVFEIGFCRFKTLFELLSHVGIRIEGIDEPIVPHNVLVGGKFGSFPKREKLWEGRTADDLVTAYNLVSDHTCIQVPLVLNPDRAPSIHKGNGHGCNSGIDQMFLRFELGDDLKFSSAGSGKCDVQFTRAADVCIVG